ncbi:MAG TPA: hypothetical protein VJV23_13070 [Candidatus Polarisedimenticolia bacterium]|nr:hypothetical protein [Candidatus Polarisedimenticolia bacterium]
MESRNSASCTGSPYSVARCRARQTPVLLRKLRKLEIPTMSTPAAQRSGWKERAARVM